MAREMSGKEWTGETSEEAKKRCEEAVEYLDVAGEAALDRVAVLCGTTYGDVIRAYITLNGEKVAIELLRCDAPGDIDTVGPGEPIAVLVHRVDLIDEMNYTRLYGDELRTIRPIKPRDGGQRKGWQTCHGPAQTMRGRHKR